MDKKMTKSEWLYKLEIYIDDISYEVSHEYGDRPADEKIYCVIVWDDEIKAFRHGVAGCVYISPQTYIVTQARYITGISNQDRVTLNNDASGFSLRTQPIEWSMPKLPPIFNEEV